MRNLRTFFLSGSIVLTVIVLVVAFQNIQAQCNFITFFFYQVENQTSPTLLAFGAAVIGIITGGFYMGLIMSYIAKDEDDEDF